MSILMVFATTFASTLGFIAAVVAVLVAGDAIAEFMDKPEPEE